MVRLFGFWVVWKLVSSVVKGTVTVAMWLIEWLLGIPDTRVTDATWLADGTRWVGTHAHRPYFAQRYPSRRHLRAGWKRAARRWAVIGAVVALAWGWKADALTTAWAVVIVAAVLVGIYGDAALRGIVGWRHRRDRIMPLHYALAPAVGIDPDVTRPAQWLRVPRRYRDDDAVIRVGLPVSVVAGEEDDEFSFRGSRSALRQNVTGAVYEKLGLHASEMRAQFYMTGAHPYVEFRHLPPVPRLVSVTDALPALGAARETAPLLGMGRDTRPITVDLDAEAPHIMMSIGTGGGKSQLARGVIAQMLHHGGRVVILDIKRTSQSWVKAHPHVIYCRDPQEMHDTLIGLDAEIIRRQTVSDSDDGGYVGPRILIVVEERNATVEVLKSFWSENKPRGATGQSPAITALNNLAFMGREPKMHLLSIAQYGDARTMGGGAGRENYGCRILGRATRNAWRMLAPEVTKVPRRSNRRGRFHVVMEDSAVEVQGVLWGDEEAREWAWGCFPEGRDTRVSQLAPEDFYRGVFGETVSTQPETETDCDGPEVAVITNLGDGPDNDPDGFLKAFEDIISRSWERSIEAAPQPIVAPVVVDVQDSPVAEAAAPEPVTLKEAADNGIVELSDTPQKTLYILRAAKKRDAEFPAPVQMRGSAQLFNPDALQRWARNRERG